MSICFNVRAIEEQFGPRLTIKRCALLVIPSIAHIVFIFHLCYLGYSWYIAALPIVFMLLSFFSVPNIHRLNQVLLLGYSMQWLYTTYDWVHRGIAMGQSLDATAMTMMIVSLWTFVSLFVFNTPTLSSYYPEKRLGA